MSESQDGVTLWRSIVAGWTLIAAAVLAAISGTVAAGLRRCATGVRLLREALR